MPELPTFTAQPRRYELPGSNSGAVFEAARGAARTVREASGAVLEQVERAGVSSMQASFAEKRAVWTVRLKEAADAAIPGDMNFAYKFVDEISKDLDKLGENVQTRAERAAYDALRTNLVSDMYERAGVHQATISGLKAKQDVLTMLDRYGNALLNDPTQFDKVLEEMMVGLGAKTNLPAAVRNEIKRSSQEELARFAVQGVIRNIDPALAKQQLQDGHWDTHLKPEMKAMLLGQAEQGINAQRIEAERMKRLEQAAMEAEREETRNDFMQRFVDGELSTKDVLDSNLESFGDGSKKSFLDMIDRKAREPDIIRTDTATKMRLFNRIHLPDGHAEKLTNEGELYKHYGRGLNDTDINWLRGEIQMRRTVAGRIESDLKKQFLDTIQRQVSTTNLFTGKVDPIGDENYQRFLVWFEQEYQRKRTDGTAAADLLDPDSPAYLGKYAKQFIKDPMQQIREQADKIRGERRAPTTPLTGADSRPAVPEGQPLAPVPRKPGETPEQYLERIKGR